jgi:hypothetical protein
MLKEKLKSIFQFYVALIYKIAPKSVPYHWEGEDAYRLIFTLPPNQRFTHLLSMCQEAQTCIDSDHVEKAICWLGFVQGALWSHGYCTFAELKQHVTFDEGK